MAESANIDWSRARAWAPEYPWQAFQFVHDGLAHTARLVHGDTPRRSAEETRHITGQQLCLGLRDFALRQYGLLARSVLRRWNVNATDDFGRIVYAMIDAGMMRKSEDDQPEHFHAVFEFDEAFEEVPLNR